MRNVPESPQIIRRTCAGCKAHKALLGGRKTPKGWMCCSCVQP